MANTMQSGGLDVLTTKTREIFTFFRTLEPDVAAGDMFKLFTTLLKIAYVLRKDLACMPGLSIITG